MRMTDLMPGLVWFSSAKVSHAARHGSQTAHCLYSALTGSQGSDFVLKIPQKFRLVAPIIIPNSHRPFSSHPCPAGSQVDGKVYRKPPISIFQTGHTPLALLKQETPNYPTPAPSQPVQNDSAAVPSPPKTPTPVVDRAKDDVSAHYSDIEGTPPIR